MTYLIVGLITGLSYVLIGWAFGKYPPKKISKTYGFRSQTAMRSLEAFVEAHLHSCQIMLNAGLITIILGALGYLLGMESDAWLFVFIMAHTLLVPLWIYYGTESYLEKNFDENGVKRTARPSTNSSSNK